MNDPTPIHFTCNICGSHNEIALDQLDRERRSCSGCNSSVRLRAMIHMLSMSLFGESLVIDEFPQNEYRGVGLSDWPGYATRLPQKMDYTNTYYHKEPRLDITNVEDARLESCDFLIASDVFEHVLSPVSRAFEGAWRLLKPRGVMIFSVPFTLRGTDTVEHFSDLQDFEVLQVDGDYRLVNRRASGGVDVYDGLRFHGGPGETLEMRLFCRHSLIRELEAAGFEVEIFDQQVWERGIYWPQAWSLPLYARKPDA